MSEDPPPSTWAPIPGGLPRRGRRRRGRRGWRGVYGMARLRSNAGGGGSCDLRPATVGQDCAAWRAAKSRHMRCARAVSRARPLFPGRRRPRRGPSPNGGGAPCCSTCGPLGAYPAARRCRRSTRCRPSWAAPVSRSSPSISTPAIPEKPLDFLKQAGVEAPRLLLRSECQDVSGLKAAGKRVRHADDAARGPAPAANSAPWPAPPNGRARMG